MLVRGTCGQNASVVKSHCRNQPGQDSCGANRSTSVKRVSWYHPFSWAGSSVARELDASLAILPLLCCPFHCLSSLGFQVRETVSRKGRLFRLSLPKRHTRCPSQGPTASDDQMAAGGFLSWAGVRSTGTCGQLTSRVCMPAVLRLLVLLLDRSQVQQRKTALIVLVAELSYGSLFLILLAEVLLKQPLTDDGSTILTVWAIWASLSVAFLLGAFRSASAENTRHLLSRSGRTYDPRLGHSPSELGGPSRMDCSFLRRSGEACNLSAFQMPAAGPVTSRLLPCDRHTLGWSHRWFWFSLLGTAALQEPVARHSGVGSRSRFRSIPGGLAGPG